MSVIGSNCLVLASGQLHPGIIRAASQPAYRTSNFSQIKVSTCPGVENGAEFVSYRCTQSFCGNATVFDAIPVLQICSYA